MTLPFMREVINDGVINTENFKHPNFVGYLNPHGIPISFSDKFGYRGHGEGLSLQERFRVYYILKIKISENMSPLEKYNMSKKFLRSEKERYITALKNNIIVCKEDIVRDKNFHPPYTVDQMALDVYNFFLNCYCADTFFDGIGKIEYCMSELDFWNYEYENKSIYDIDDYDFRNHYKYYIDKLLVEIFKEVMISYLGYHSVERVSRTITTSSSNIYETFYNYLLNDFTIYQIPKMIFDSKEKKYVQQNHNEFLIPDSELRLKDEIQAIKKLVPLREREKYFR